MKKLITMAVVVFAFALTMNVAFAGYHHHPQPQPSDDCSACPTLNVTANNNSSVFNKVSTSANTGMNFSKVRHHGFSMVKTGDALATSYNENWVGSNEVRVNAPESGETDVTANNNSSLFNMVNTSANSGKNAAFGGFVKTGNASAGASAFNYVGYNLVVVN